MRGGILHNRPRRVIRLFFTMVDTTPYWVATGDLPEFPALTKELKVDVLVIGGGMTGVSAAYLLKKAGRKVALIESSRLVMRDTAHTTAHVTCVTDTRLRELVETFGKEHARAAWEAGWAALEQIQTTVREEQIDCEFVRVPAYLHAPKSNVSKAEIDALREDAALASELGFDAVFMDQIPLMNAPGVRFANQAKFHPRKYLAALARRVDGDGSFIFEKTEAHEFRARPFRVIANGCPIHCDQVVIATHSPLQGRQNVIGATLLQSKLALYSTYAVGARIGKGSAPEASFWDTADPYNYLRIDSRADSDYAILGGSDHKTGQESDTEQSYAAIEEQIRALFPGAELMHRWSGQVIETPDGLPYIGEVASKQFIATGFAGNGMTFGTLAGIMARDLASGVKNPWRELFDPHRKKLRGVVDYLIENKDYPFYLVRDRLAGGEESDLAQLQPGDGKIVRLGKEKVAAYRELDGTVKKLSPVCPHLGCIVHWNGAEKTWDCPCHGSRFAPNGERLGGPAEDPLDPA
jgi:glycine/D-amino acid oxidase-like deaminating enzyme/nitrite reductase/ring-hydroxylating ferredoxin subunit